MSGRVKEGPLVWWASQVTKSNGDLLKVGLQIRTYSDYLRAAREADKKIPWSCPRA